MLIRAKPLIRKLPSSTTSDVGFIPRGTGQGTKSRTSQNMFFLLLIFLLWNNSCLNNRYYLVFTFSMTSALGKGIIDFFDFFLLV